MKILTLDLEMAPSVVHRWASWGNDTTGVEQVIDPGHLLCAAYRWHSDPDGLVGFVRSSRYELKGEYIPNHGLRTLWDQLDFTDVLVTYNGKKFDIPKLNTEFLLAGFDPPSPFQHIDLYQVIRKNFGFFKNGLDYVTRQVLELGKAQHEGHSLWVKCMAGDPEAWETMRGYNVNDVIITEQLYDKLIPWIPAHPNVLLYEEDPIGIACTRCGSANYQKRGFRVASTRRYQQYQCNECGGWFRDTRSIDGAAVTG